MVEETEVETLNDYFEAYEHLFVIAGVFAALAIYLADLQRSPEFANSGFLQLGMFSAFFLFLCICLLTTFYLLSHFTDFTPESYPERHASIVRFGFLGLFMLAFYYLLATAFSTLVSLSGAFSYFAGSLLVAVFMILIVSPLFYLSVEWDIGEVRWHLMLAVSGYLFLWALVHGLLIIYLQIESGVLPSKTANVEAYASPLKMAFGVLSFGSFWGVLISLTLSTLSMGVALLQMVSEITEQVNHYEY